MKMTAFGWRVCTGCDVQRAAVRFTVHVLLALGILLCVAGGGLAGSGTALAAEPDEASGPADWKECLKEITISVKAHKKAFDLTGLQDDLERAQALYEEARADDKFCGQVIKLVGSMTRGSKDMPLATAMLRSLAEIGDPRGARYVKPYLRQADKKQAPAMLGIAVDVAADVRHPSLVKPLLDIVLKSKTFGIASKCVASLGHYKDVKKARCKILEALIKTTKKSKPGGQGRMSGGGGSSMDDTGGGTSGSGRNGGAGARWGALSRSVPTALRKLTGQDFGRMEEWFDVLKQYKGKYRDLFTEE